MAVSLEDLTTPVTKEQVEAKLYEVLERVGVTTTSWKPGAVVRTIIAGVSIFFGALSKLQANIAKSGFLELAAGDWLTLIARYVYNEERDPATFAPGEFTLANSGGGSYTVDPDDLIVYNPATGKAYRNTDAFVLGPSATLTIAILAVEAGSASTSGPNTITAFETPLGGPGVVTGTNATAVVGQDEESDPSLRTRCYEKLGALSPNGPWDAYSYAARRAKRADGTAIGVTRVRTTRDGFGFVRTYVATASGGVSGAADNPATDLGAINDAIQRQAAPLAVTAETYSASPVTLAVTYQAWLYNTSGLTEDAIKTAISTALATYLSTQPVGGNKIGTAQGKIFLDALRTVIGSAVPGTFHVVVSLPAADAELAVNEVPVLGTVLGTITQIAPPEGGV